ncbi:hypothetical protein [Streptomyces sp. NPDC047061]|uniref:hypothetical protein n=1 Tax=Streptomyces sp. NPDC047061 TaxID=3154605 RepID=UPI0033E6BCBC
MSIRQDWATGRHVVDGDEGHTDYMFSILNEVFVGTSATVHVTETVTVTVTRADGTHETFSPDG